MTDRDAPPSAHPIAAPSIPASDRDPLLAGLSEEQAAVVLSPPGPLLVLAGAGSGKTRALTHRVAYFLRHGVAPERILLVTFTNQAARSLLARLAALHPLAARGRMSGDNDNDLWAGTFHHLALRVLRQHGYRVGLPDRFVVLDRAESADLLASCMEDLVGGRPTRDRPLPRAAQLQSLLSLSINAETSLEQILCAHAPELLDIAPLLSQIYDRYTNRKLRMGLCDFDDLLLLWRLLLCDHRVVRDQQRGRFQHLFIDEFQDTSRIQSAICEDIAQGYRSLTVVGDDAQSIYRFRGAHIENIRAFPTRWPDARVLYLSTNYRSQPAIVSVSNATAAHHGPSGSARPAMRSGRSPRPGAIQPALVALPDVRLQARFVTQRIAELLSHGVPARDIAVLYRSHRHARELQVELLRCQIPYTVRSGQRVSEQAHIRDVLAFLRLCNNPRDRIAWTRVLRQVAGLGDTGRARILGELDVQLDATPPGVNVLPDAHDRLLRHARGDSRRGVLRLFALLGELRELARQPCGGDPSTVPARLLSHLIDRHYRDYALRAFTDAEQRLADLDGLCRSRGPAADGQVHLPFGATQPSALPVGPQDALATFLAGTAVSDEATGLRRDDEAAVVLSSVHQAKGLEWRIVFVLWLCEGHFPAAPAVTAHDDPGALAEERRLFYVAITRACDELYLCHPQGGGPYGLLRRSRFLDEVDQVSTPIERWRIQIEH